MPSSSPIPIWLDVDTGHDDAFALLLAAQHPSLTLLGVSTTYGNAPLAATTHNTLAILTALSRATAVPVYPGAAQSFVRGPAAAPQIHGVTGLDGTTCLPTPTVAAQTEVPAIVAMAAALRATPPRTAWIVATGALTNLALLLAVYPDLAGHVAGVSIMGGAIGGGFAAPAVAAVGGAVTDAAGRERVGNWTPWAEFNIYIDPESAAAVLGNPALQGKLVLVPIDLTHQFLATEEVVRMMRWGKDGEVANAAGAKSPTRLLFAEILTFFAATYAEIFGLTAGPPLHDPLAVAAVLAPELFHDNGGEQFAVEVITAGAHGDSTEIREESGSQCGRTVATLLPEGQKGVRIPRSLEIGKVWAVLEGCLARAEEEAAGAAEKNALA